MKHLACLLVFALAFPAAAQSWKAMEGRWARYQVVAGPQALPTISEVVLSLPAREKVDGKEAVWFQLEVFSGTQRIYALAMLVSGLDFLYSGALPVEVHRYVLFPANGTPLEYVAHETGKALLPKIDFFAALLPRAAAVTDPEMPFFSEGVYLGRTLQRQAQGKKAVLLPLTEAQQLTIEREVLIGTSRSFRDDGRGRLHPAGAAWDASEEDYRYVPLDEADYLTMIEAGFNIFRVPLEHLPWIIEKPVYFLVRNGFEEMPEILYRSNFFGAVMYMDEPAIHAMWSGMVTRTDDPRFAASVVQELTRGRYEGRGQYGMRNLDLLLRRAGYDFGAELLQPDYPVWETVPSAAWYEQEAGIAGWCFEGRYQPQWFAALIEDQLGVDFPADAESCVRFHHAFFTGAARHFSSQWGVAIYGQMDLAAAEIVFPLAYSQGATYFWFWTSDKTHHVPFSEQLEHTRNFRKYIAKHPRLATRQELTAQARTAVALPWGYLCDHYCLKVYDRHFEGGEHAGGRMWWSASMELEDLNRQGVPYREVLAAAVRQSVSLLQEDIPFDFVFLHAGEQLEGYDKLYRVLETSEIVVEKPRHHSDPQRLERE